MSGECRALTPCGERPCLAATLCGAAPDVEGLVAARNYAMRQRDGEREAKEGNLAALNVALIQRDEARAEVERLTAKVARVELVCERWEERGGSFNADEIRVALKDDV